MVEPSTDASGRPSSPGEVAGPSRGEAEPVPPAAVRLGPRAEDLRFWVPVDLRRRPMEPPPRTPGDHLVEAMRAFFDSVAAAEAAKPRDTSEWLRTDRAGGGWGISPGELHLGTRTIPFCGGGFSTIGCGFGVPSGKLEGTLRKARMLREIESSAYRESMRNHWSDRAEAMRKRKDEERKAKRRSGGG